MDQYKRQCLLKEIDSDNIRALLEGLIQPVPRPASVHKRVLEIF